MKWSLLALVLLLVLPVAAGASTSRLMGMGVQGDFVKDYTNIFTYPSCLPNVGNIVYGELGQATDYDYNYAEYFTTEDRSVGAVLGNLFDGKFGAIGFTMREYSPALGTNFQPYVGWEGYLDEYAFGNGFDTFEPYLDPNVPGSYGDAAYTNGYGTEAFDLMWGKKLDKLSLGLRLNRSYWNVKYTPGTEEYSGYEPYDRNIFGFGGGIGYDLSDKSMLEGSFLYQSRTFEYTSSGGDKYESDGGGAYMLSARMLWQWKPDVQIVPMGRYYKFDLSEKQTGEGTTVTTDENIHGWQLGAAGNWTLNQNDLFVLGLSFAQNIYENKTIDNEAQFTESLMPSMFAALETHVNPWLTIRFGGHKGVFYSEKDEDKSVDPTTVEERKMSPFVFYLGTGVKLGTLQLDATLAQDFFHNPASYVTSPNNVYTPLFPRVTATYSF